MIVVCFSSSISKFCRFSGINLTVAERNPHSFWGLLPACADHITYLTNLPCVSCQELPPFCICAAKVRRFFQVINTKYTNR